MGAKQASPERWHTLGRCSTYESYFSSNMNMLFQKLGFSGFYALAFGIISAIAAVIIVPQTSGKGWEYLWLYAGSAAMITAFSLSKIFVESKRNFAIDRLLIIGSVVAIISHWLCWYIAILVNFFQWKYIGMYRLVEPLDPISGIYGALLLSMTSLVFFGWTAIPISMFLIVLTKKLKAKLVTE